MSSTTAISDTSPTPAGKPMQDEYHVMLSNFKGPLDLLLFLIRRSELDITDIPIAQITDQYLAFLGGIDQIDIEVAGDFLVMAATLIEIKSRVLRPTSPKGAGGEAEASAESAERDGLDGGDPRYELIQQLLAYQKYRIAAEQLDVRREEFERRFAIRPTRFTPAADDQSEAVELDLDDVHLMDLFDAYERILATIDFSKLGEHSVEYDDTPIELHAEDIVDRIARAERGCITLQEAFRGRTRGEVIGLFLATLELVKQRRVKVRQDDLRGEIVLELHESVPEEPDGSDVNEAIESPSTG